MSQARPKFSVIIPAYNRSNYLRYTLDTCVSQSFPSVEFIVQDDHSSDDTYEMVSQYCSIDSRIVYQNIGQNSGMRGNFERALENASGEYVICLGSDDALIPDTLHELAEVTERHPLKVITWPIASYHYDKARGGRGQMMVPHVMFERYSEVEISSSDYWKRQTDKLFYADDHKAPMLYVKSCVPKSIIEKIKCESGGVFFSSSTPDGYSGFAIASICPTYIYINKLYTMHGVSPSSAGLNYVSGGKDSNNQSEKFFTDSKSIPMAGQLASAPYSPLITLMTADFIYQTDYIFKHNYSRNISIENVIAKSLAELCDGLFSRDKISRELEILIQISKYHNKYNFLLNQLSQMRRNSRTLLTGDAISANFIYLDMNSKNINNVFDAANFIKNKRNSRKIYFHLKWIKAIFNALNYKSQSYDWCENLAAHLSKH